MNSCTMHVPIADDGVLDDVINNQLGGNYKEWSEKEEEEEEEDSVHY